MRVLKVSIAWVLYPSLASAFAPGSTSKLRTPTTLRASDEFVVGVLGDLHMDPRKMEDYGVGRSHFLPIFEEANSKHGNVALVSLGDLGESKSVRPEETSELFAGTTECHEMAAEFLSSFGVPYDVVGGNHDLEGLDEFETDRDNLEMYLRVHNKETPNFCREIADKTLLVGMGSTVFRDAVYTSHEVTIDQQQIDWFEKLVKDHPAEDGWKVFVFTHAPPNGSGLRVLQENHVVNGCCWLNHSNEKQCKKFIELVREHRCIKAWFSGHFHLGQDYQDSITFPTIDPKDGPYPNRGSCVFAQTSVMRAGTSRDGRQQSRLIRGNKDGFEICTVDHQKDGKIRLDATITYRGDSNEVGVYAHEDEAYDHDSYFKVYAPSAGDKLHPPDDGFRRYNSDGNIEPFDVEADTVAWWYMSCGRALGMLNGNLIEYDSSTLAPLGLVVGADELVGKKIGVINSGLDADTCQLLFDEEEGMEGADCAALAGDLREQAVVLLDKKTGQVTVVQPNEDGSYWRKIVRNKMVRMKEVRRIKAAKQWAAELMGVDEAEANVVSSWGPYTTTSGTAKKTSVPGLTAPSAL
uniref:Calcineurin-like phosphoesterase domain-containing protein n=1 Tax=Rhizochromulina marina TaxID=1034831 RepID=A0A7S2S2N5_9STRA|mmetsp:Transcript_11364/g.22758  ORF Transcript_11364/g.22758 Transcript_11364/m.22758 type:complete len:578 (+) Transcript_11364:107-1840(+)|eukprot:CAMPEP_0171336010 /NCGR_PEP_ID=MMETSP0878-20121228/5712_1 /TAXON_ID=67004 /ORGANISM="Thalassiosira weissflogii, Strain CCMP1336" /LENGTH=577 /DNA_ID=CAMNT_0011837377 /DNA_START=113 /DNA_END=1846 /DNA_ORIENTATION=+